MRLLFCIDHFGSGGAQRQLVTLALGLHGRGHDIEFFVYHPRFRHFAPMIEASRMRVHAFDKARKYSLRVPSVLARLVRTGEYDAVLSFLPTPSVYAELASVLVRHTPLVVSERFMYTSLTRMDRLLQQLHRLASHITVNSHHQRERMTRLFPWMATKITTIYNGVDLDVFAPEPGRVGSSWSQAADPTSGPRLLAVGSTARKKNALGLVGALVALRERREILPTVAWAGRWTASSDDARAKQEVDEALVANGLVKQWTWLGEREDIPELMRQADALVHPAFFEGLPNAVCEALACGLPVLVSDVCDHPRLVTDGDNGFLFDPHDTQSIADAVVRFTRLQAFDRVRMGTRGRGFAVRELSLDRYVEDYEALFTGLLERPVSGRRSRLLHDCR